MNFANDILDAIEIMVKQVVEDNVTKIYTGVCKTIGVNNCVLTINGKDNTVKYYGGVPVVGTVYQVFIPFGNMSAAFIIVPGSGGGSGGSGVDSVNGKTGDVVLNAADVGALPNTTVIPSKTSQLTNDSGYITVSGAPVKSVDGKTGAVVTNAVKTTQQSLTDAQKSQARINIGAGTSSFDGNYNSLSGKPTIPSNTSQLNNDSGFVTSENVPVKSVNGKTGDVVLTATDVKALPSNTTIPTKTSQLTNDSEFITLAQVPTAPVQSVNGQTGAVTLDKTDVGLGKVPNVTTNDQTPTYTQASSLANIISGEKLSVSMGKIMKAIADLISHLANKTNPHNVTKTQVGLGNVDNTSDADKPVSTSQATAIADAKKAGTDAQSNLSSHINNKSNPHNVTAEQIGVNNATLTIQKNGVTVDTFTANSSVDKTVNITVPTTPDDIGAISKDNISQTLGTSTTKVPSEKAVTDAMEAAGYGDMLKSVYDATGAIANGGGIVNYIKTNGFTFLGVNPISSTSDDTTANWAALGTGYARYDTTGLLINQPSRWSFVINFNYDGDIFQIWNTQDRGPMYYRCGNVNGWGKSWTKILDATDLIVSNAQPSGQAVGGIWYQTT